MEDLVYGIHAVREILKYNPENISIVYFLKTSVDYRLKTLVKEIKKLNFVNVVGCSRNWMDCKVSGELHQGIIVKLLKNKNYLNGNELTKFLAEYNSPTLLILDGITDSRNFGACLRSADAAGIDGVIIPGNRTASINAIARKVASGAADRVPVFKVVNLSRTINLLKKNNIWIIGTVTNSEHVFFKSKLIGSIALIIGSENKGIRSLTKKCCDELISIPMFGSVESLNVAVATGILLFEIVRQRMYK